VLLRRITSHVDEQNWFAVVVDLIIVIVGVFIGIQVANWNDELGDQRLGHYYTARLITDLESDLAVGTTLFDYYNQVLESVEEADRLLAATNPDAQAVVVAAYRASEFNNNPTNSATWDQIVSSGHIGLLQSPAIERGLSEYYKYQGPLNAGNFRVLDSPYRLAVRSLIPLPVQLAIRESCSDVWDELKNSTGLVSECGLDIDDSELRRTADALLSSNAVRETLRHQYSRVAFVTINLESNIIQIEELLDALRSKQVK
jgi:hypothetical protein